MRLKFKNTDSIWFLYALLKVELRQKLEELRSERLKVTDEVCELLSNVPPSRITTLFGPSAAHVQRKLAVRWVYHGVM